jgi:hypothetical protein
LPAKQCKRDQNSLAVCSSFIKRRHFACITSAAPRTLFSEAALASGIRVCKSIARARSTTPTYRSYRNSRECVNTHHFRMSLCVFRPYMCVCGYDVSFWAHYSHNAGAREAVAACMRVLCMCMWGCRCLAVLQRTYKRAITSWPCHSASLQTTGLRPRTHAKLHKSIFMAQPL